MGKFGESGEVKYARFELKVIGSTPGLIEQLLNKFPNVIESDALIFLAEGGAGLPNVRVYTWEVEDPSFAGPEARTIADWVRNSGRECQLTWWAVTSWVI